MNGYVSMLLLKHSLHISILCVTYLKAHSIVPKHKEIINLFSSYSLHNSILCISLKYCINFTHCHYNVKDIHFKLLDKKAEEFKLKDKSETTHVRLPMNLNGSSVENIYKIQTISKGTILLSMYITYSIGSFCLNILLMDAIILSRCSGFLPELKNMTVRLTFLY